MEKKDSTRGYILKKAEALPEFDDDPNAPSFGNGGSRGFDGPRSKVLSSKDDAKLFVGGMPYDINDQTLLEIFRKDGYNPVDCMVVKDSDGNSKGFGFAIFSDEREARKACALNGKRVGNRPLNVNMASDKPDRRSSSTRNGRGGRR